MALRNPVEVTSVEKITSAASYDTKAAPSDGSADTSPASEEKAVAAEAAPSTSLFAKLPGELRNRIYHLHFGNFHEMWKTYYGQQSYRYLKELAPWFLNLLHTDRMVRSEAGSIFF